MFKGLEWSTRNNNFVQFKAGDIDVPEPPDPLVEPNDMLIVASPCHAWEPIKIPEDHTGSVYCLVCGAAFAV